MTDCSADTACESKITYLGLIQPLSKAVHRYLATFLCHQALLYSPVPVCLTLPAVGLLQLASAAGSKSENVQKPAQGKLSWTLQRGSEGAQRRYSKAATYFHLHWIPKVGCPSRLPRPATFQVPTIQTSGAPTALLFSAPLTLLDDSHVDNIHLPLSQEMVPSRAAPKYRALWLEMWSVIV